MDRLGQGVPWDRRGLGEVLEAGMGGGDKGTREQEVSEETKKRIWLVF